MVSFNSLASILVILPLSLALPAPAPTTAFALSPLIALTPTKEPDYPRCPTAIEVVKTFTWMPHAGSSTYRTSIALTEVLPNCS